MSLESDIVRSVVRLTEESDDSSPPSVEASPTKSRASPDVVVEEETTEEVAEHQEGENKESEQDGEQGGEQGEQGQKKKREKKKKVKESKDPKAWRVRGQRSKMTRQSKLVPYLKKTDGPLIGLEHVTEYHDEDPLAPLMYTCSLCEVKLSSENVVQLTQHLTGFKHRLTYLKKHQGELEEPFSGCEIDGFDSLETLKRPDQTALITKLSQDLEEKTGRKYEEIDVFVIVNQAYRQGRQYGDGYVGNYGNRRGGHGYQHKSKYHPANAHLYGNDAGFFPQQQSGGPGMNTEAFTRSTGTMSFADVLPLLYRCEILDEEDAGHALQASNLINKRILEFNTATSWNRRNQYAFCDPGFYEGSSPTQTTWWSPW